MMRRAFGLGVLLLVTSARLASGDDGFLPDGFPDPGFHGHCDGETGIWFDGTDVHNDDCAAAGLGCYEDACEFGAACCPSSDGVCDPAGAAGTCSYDGTSATWCGADALESITCSAGKTCQRDACSPGVDCCDPPPADTGGGDCPPPR